MKLHIIFFIIVCNFTSSLSANVFRFSYSVDMTEQYIYITSKFAITKHISKGDPFENSNEFKESYELVIAQKGEEPDLAQFSGEKTLKIIFKKIVSVHFSKSENVLYIKAESDKNLYQVSLEKNTFKKIDNKKIVMIPVSAFYDRLKLKCK